MKKYHFLLLLLANNIYAQILPMPNLGDANITKYTKICRENIYKDMKGMYREKGKAMQYPFLAPGSQAYHDMIWDWDSWLSNVALRQILLENGNTKDSLQALDYEKGCVLNFLSFGSLEGYIPEYILREDKTGSERRPANYTDWNMHKPVLAQHAAFIVKNTKGDAEWLRESFFNLQAFQNNYLSHYRNQPTGLLFWATDGGIGVDNDPSTFGRPYKSSGSIFLNCMMFKEMLAMVYLANQLNLNEISTVYQKHADEMKAAIQKNCWDERNGFYYSVDLNLRYHKPETNGWLHTGDPLAWHCLIQRIDVWSGFLTMWAGIAKPEEAKRMVEENYRNTKTFNSPAGVRSLSKLEKMYAIKASGNPSCWLGPVWINANYLTWKGLVKYGYLDDAKDLAKKTIVILGYDYERYGALHEYYQPDNGQPVINKGFQNWNFLVLNMAAWLEGKPFIEEF